ncbi:UDP-N-acetylglucosamine 2-epimerase (hydrolyzing) [Pelagibacterales bacterium SAG-MED46]|nr:UDP-N-acetylglucosamine 2-epimerase (hydrolyzing) [Pelagibacterales bacterium SAG-MED46]
MKKKIILYSSSRADIDRYIPILKKISQEKIFQPIIFLSSFHKRSQFGNYLYEIKKLKIKIIQSTFKKKLNDTYVSKIEHYCFDMKNLNKILIKNKPSFLILLGDRFEIVSAAMPAILQNIPIIHFYGGSITEGAIDDKIRHAITKLSNIHFVANKKYLKRIIHLGEESWRTKLVGLDYLNELKNQKFLSKKNFFKKLKISTGEKTLFATFHPITLEKKDLNNQIKNFLKAIEKTKFQCIFTYPNSDMGFEIILKKIKEFIRKNQKKYILLKKLNIEDYANLIKNCDLVIGNSSMGIVDTAAFKKPVVNIGTRQKGKIFPKNVINSSHHYKEILKSIKFSQSSIFKKQLLNLKNPYSPRVYNLSKFLYNLMISKKNKINIKKFIDK